MFSKQKQVDFEIHQQIDNLLALYSRRNGDRLPVDVEILVNLLAKLIDKKIELVERDVNGRGYTVSVQGGFLIYVNHSDTLSQKRFTIGHEIGHILHTFDYTKETPHQRPERASYAFYSIRKEEESICDEIAMYILCPQKLLIEILKGFSNIPCQLDLLRKKQIPPYYSRMKLLSEIFDSPLSKFIWYIERRFGEEKLLSWINST